VLASYLYKGTHLSRRNVTHTRGRVVRAEVTSSTAALLDIDGEAPGRLDATFRLHPAAIRLLERG
ncbi:MAG: hypothetical protein WCJ30_11385, partial [Deltaproteobacteria bacterium]